MNELVLPLRGLRLRLGRIWRVVPVPIVVVDRLPARLAAICVGPAIVVRCDFADDWPTIAHELQHCRQFWRGGTILHLLRYCVSPRYRLQAELDAFRAEIAAADADERGRRLDAAARALASGYRIGLSARDCRRLLAAGA